MTADAPFEPRVVAFLCHWCAYAGADAAGAMQLHLPPNVHVVRVLCAGRVDPQAVLLAFTKGADGVLILGCSPGDCHHKEQNLRALQRHQLLQRVLGACGIPAARCRFGFVSSCGAEAYRRMVTTAVRELRELGPLSRNQHAGRD